MIPFHKQTDPNKQAGQVVYKITIIDNNHPNGIPYEEWVRPIKCDCAQAKYNDEWHSRSCSSVYGFDREPYLKHSNAAPDVTLSDYIARKQEGEKKLTFDEWIADHEDASAESIWYAALRYGKIS